MKYKYIMTTIKIMNYKYIYDNNNIISNWLINKLELL